MAWNVPRLVMGALVATEVAMGLLLFKFSWDSSWHWVSPPGSDVRYREFVPYATFYPAIVVLALSLGSIGPIALDWRDRSGGHPWLRGIAGSHILIGAILLVATGVTSVAMICPYGRGCYSYFEFYPPLVVPPAIVFLAGVVGALYVRWANRGGGLAPVVATP